MAAYPKGEVGTVSVNGGGREVAGCDSSSNHRLPRSALALWEEKKSQTRKPTTLVTVQAQRLGYISKPEWSTRIQLLYSHVLGAENSIHTRAALELLSIATIRLAVRLPTDAM
jgi:hypothetical protein